MSLLRTIGAALRPREEPVDDQVDDTPRVLNVGGNTKAIPIPSHYQGWNHLLLDIDPKCNPDVLCDARELGDLDAGQFDAVYCSHNLEHYYVHDGRKVLAGFVHVLKDDGFAEIRVPDLQCLKQHVGTKGRDVDDTLYQVAGGPIAVRDVIYGWGRQIETSGVDFFAHKTGFTPKSLQVALARAGFGEVYVQERPEMFEVAALAFKTRPNDWHRTHLDI